MKRRGPILALALALALPGGPAPAAGAAQARDLHEHRGYAFRIRVEPDLNQHFVYRVFIASPDDPGSLLVERSDGFLGDAGSIDLTPATCPALRPAVEALASLPLPAIVLESPGGYDSGPPRPVQYHFDGFVRFPNSGVGEVSFMSYDVPGHPRDPQLEWMRGLVRAFDGCRPRRSRRE